MSTVKSLTLNKTNRPFSYGSANYTKTCTNELLFLVKMLNKDQAPGVQHRDAVINTASSVLILSSTMLETADCVRLPLMCMLETAKKKFKVDKCMS